MVMTVGLADLLACRVPMPWVHAHALDRDCRSLLFVADNQVEGNVSIGVLLGAPGNDSYFGHARGSLLVGRNR